MSDGLPVPERYWSALTIWLGITMAVLDPAVANVTLPTIAHDLSTTAAESIWVVSAYQLTIVVSCCRWRRSAASSAIAGSTWAE
ncbi:MAG TPA: hypothetical protein VGV37_02170 [Aliidongia sp.]|uniref:hypothetical protein n=1 Tax=Aliidongia sp. TaxID=1914230 RepID=UPI002DDD2031|nr:hypothetical protein [Aliidongia sp.]HEV2673317.1 hypothetical protein [Aliidongia sp.]